MSIPSTESALPSLKSLNTKVLREKHVDKLQIQALFSCYRTETGWERLRLVIVALSLFHLEAWADIRTNIYTPQSPSGENVGIILY